MNYISAKEQRVITAWEKRGVSGLRIRLLTVVEQCKAEKLVGEDIIKRVSMVVFGTLPEREWGVADGLIRETCGLLNIDSDDWSSEVMTARLTEKQLREDLGDD